MLRVLLVGTADQHRIDARTALMELGDPPIELFEAALSDPSPTNGGPPPDVVMVLFDGANEERALSFFEEQADLDPGPALFALVPERSPVLMRRILRAGADELLFMPIDAGDVTRALLKISESRRREERETGGQVVAIVSTVGGVGVTSLVANLALALKRNFNKRVAVVDLDLQTGGLAVFLNLEPERTIMHLGESDRKLYSIQLEAALTKHGSGIYLLAAPKRVEDSELVSDKTIAAALELMRQLFDVVIVDCGGYIDENAVAAWERADFLFYVVDQSIAAARCAWRFLDLFGRLGLNGVEPAFLLGRYQPHHPITEDQISHTLGRPIFGKIPRDEKVLERVQLRAQDIWQVGATSPMTRGIEELAHRIANGEAAIEQSTGLVSRLFSAFSGRN
jgi:pilus assembly protein CpaE